MAPIRRTYRPGRTSRAPGPPQRRLVPRRRRVFNFRPGRTHMTTAMGRYLVDQNWHGRVPPNMTENTRHVRRYYNPQLLGRMRNRMMGEAAMRDLNRRRARLSQANIPDNVIRHVGSYLSNVWGD